MHSRPQFTSVPTEIMRSIVGVSETGSFSKAAKALGISQPAISAQIKRLEDHVGGSIFLKTAHGSSATELGKLVLIQARKILEANQQLQLLRGARSAERSLRLGLSDLFARRTFDNMEACACNDVSVIADSSNEVIKGLINGFIDVGLFLQNPGIAIDPSITVLRERREELSWVRSRDFVLSPGAPIPLLTWGGQITHDIMIHALEKSGMIYRIALSSPAHQAHLEAAGRGLGITVLPKRLIPASLMSAREYYLPPLAAPTLYLGVRGGMQIKDHALLQALDRDLFDDEAAA